MINMTNYIRDIDFPCLEQYCPEKIYLNYLIFETGRSFSYIDKMLNDTNLYVEQYPLLCKLGEEEMDLYYNRLGFSLFHILKCVEEKEIPFSIYRKCMRGDDKYLVFDTNILSMILDLLSSIDRRKDLFETIMYFIINSVEDNVLLEGFIETDKKFLKFIRNRKDRKRLQFEYFYGDRIRGYKEKGTNSLSVLCRKLATGRSTNIMIFLDGVLINEKEVFKYIFKKFIYSREIEKFFLSYINYKKTLRKNELYSIKEGMII